jgi:hypothetical protein
MPAFQVAPSRARFVPALVILLLLPLFEAKEEYQERSAPRPAWASIQAPRLAMRALDRIGARRLRPTSRTSSKKIQMHARAQGIPPGP